MKKARFAKKCRAVLSAALVPVLLAGAVIAPIIKTTLPAAKASDYDREIVKKLEGVAADYRQYLNSSVMFKLPEGVSADEEISVIVTVKSANMMDSYESSDKSLSLSEYASDRNRAEALKAGVAEEKSKVLGALNRSDVSYKLGEDYSTVLSGFELLIKARDFEATCKALGEDNGIIVGEVYNTAETQLVENEVKVFGTGIFDSSDSGFDGSGIVVAVLDTGLDSNHSAFSTDRFTSDRLGLSYNDVASLVDKTAASRLLGGGLTVDDVYINEKVPFGFDYADNDSDVYSTHNNHGTHVSGVIVGNDDTIRGVAPNAQLVSMKIFSDVMETARTAWILAALEDCVVLGVDVINMSLGTSCGFSRETDEEAVGGIYDRIRDAGISMIVAASNSYSSANGSEKNGNLGLTSNPDTGTVGSPSTYDGVMSVASIAGVETPYIKYGKTIIYFTESSNAAGEENKFCDTLLGENESVDIEYVVIPGVGRSADYTGFDVNGKIALVRRGSNTFEEKAMIAQEQGAAGIIIYNNISGDIKMNVGDAKLASCSISQDDGEMLAKSNGTITISRSQTSGPFISDFSSWGPTPDLRIKPEITAHGGSILSAVTGGSYDRLSGTSMACPNLAGVVVLLRQYVVENFPEIANDSKKVNAMAFELLMSTADIALGTNGLPYAVRKQGAGLANLTSAITTKAYIKTFDENGAEMDKAKLELGDDPDKNGVYEMKFAISNFGSDEASYDIGAFVMTEGVSETKTNAGKTTVTEESYILDGAVIEILSVDNGTLKGKTVKVEGGKEAVVSIRITLSEKDKEYLNSSFENGMYVEGFITLDNKAKGGVDLNVPYLAFYGDWTVAPLFDLTYYDTNADELDDGIDFEDKVMADAYASRPVGGVSDDYVSYLGSYYFIQDPGDIVIAANENFIALSNKAGAIHSLRFVWAGLLRNAAKVDISITDSTTGEIIFTRTEKNIRKSYSDGGSTIYPANVEIEFDAAEYNLPNNSQYNVKLIGYLDYGNGGLETNENCVFEFPLTIDFEAPTVTNVEYYYKYDKSLNKNRLYADVMVYDNHYSMCSQLGYVANSNDSNGNATIVLNAFEQYMTPIYSDQNSTTRVTYELTDYIYKIKNNSANKNSFVVTVYDYALNYATYEIRLPDNFSEFYFEGLEDGLTMSPNEVYTLQPVVKPYTEWSELLDYSSSKPSVARVVNNKIVAVAPGTAIIKAQHPETNESVSFSVTVLGENDENFKKYDKPVTDIFSLDGYETLKAYYILDNKDKDIGDTGNINFFEGKYNLSMYPSETVRLNYSLDSYHPNQTNVEFESSNENIVKIDAYGNVTAVAEGFASVTIKVIMDGKSTYYSETVSVEVKDPYITTGPSLTHYYGNGGTVTIPERLSLTEIGQFAFSNFEYVAKTPEELEFDDKEISKAWYIGDNTITKVVIPEGVKKIDAYAFANLTALEEIVLPSTMESIEYGAFVGCTSLKKITFSGENNLIIINQHAFENCDLRGTLDLGSVCVISDYAFSGNQKLESVKLPETLLSVGQYAFAGCRNLKNISVEAKKVKYGAYAFTGCKALKEFTVNSAVLPEGMFYECTDMEKVTVGADVKDIGPFAFRDTKISEFTIASGNKTYKTGVSDCIISSDGTKLIAVAPVVSGEFTADKCGGSVTVIGKGAFSHNQNIVSVVLPNVVSVGDYGLASNKNLASVTLGKLESIGIYGFFESSITELPDINVETDIGKYAFSYTKLGSVIIPDGMVISEGVFSECSELSEVVIGDGVTIGSFAFSMNKDQTFKVVAEYENDRKIFKYEFSSPLKSLTIGNDAVIGENAFANAASLESITLGDNADIGNMAFYNMSSLKNIDLSKAKRIGDYALSGDVYFACLDENMNVAAVSSEGYYIYTYHGPLVESLDISSVESIGEYAFAYCRKLTDVVFGEELKSIPKYAFAGCDALKNIDLSGIEAIGEYAFMECGLESADLSAAKTVEKYGFVSNRLLCSVKLSENGTDVEEGAFCYCDPLATVENLSFSANIGDYAFAYTALTEADLTSAVSVGNGAFIKNEVTPFKVTLGDKLVSLGDNPFALCSLEPFGKASTVDINGNTDETVSYTFDISDSVFVIDGSLYCKVNTGLELITYAGIDSNDTTVADDTVRITAFAFAGSDIKRIKMPYTTVSIGHKAFYGCKELEIVIFGSYTVPIFEEEFDPAYYESLEHIPGSGNYGVYTDFNGNEVSVDGIGMIPYYMWNSTDSKYSNVFYGANFVDYVGYVDKKLIMVSPVNGVGYDSYICDSYFDYRIDGPAAPDKVTVAAINAIRLIPDKVTLDDKPLVEAAREAYNKIATVEQMALVTNYASLVSAEQRIAALEPVVEAPIIEDKKIDPDIVFGIALPVLLIGFAVFMIRKKRKSQNGDASAE